MVFCIIKGKKLKIKVIENVRFKKLKPSIQRKKIPIIWGFDIETYNNNKNFLCCSLVTDTETLFFYSVDDFRKYIIAKNTRNVWIVANNLSFDFFGSFFENKDAENFFYMFRGSGLLYAYTYKSPDGFTKDRDFRMNKIMFLDAGNYGQISVEEMGKIIKIPKLEKPHCLGKKPKNNEEWEIIKKYNIQDSIVVKKFAEFLFQGFIELGATIKKTLASTSMSLFRNKYLEQNYYVHQIDELLELFDGYYGGRTEAFARGYVKNMKYYDINSLYPSVMHDCVYPDPNSMRVTDSPCLNHIMNYEGFSKVKMYCPYMKYPLLPMKRDGKLLFPIGDIFGTYSHVELRKALELGYKLIEIDKTYYFQKTCRPFVNFVKDCYNKRNEFKKQGSPMEYIVKIMMNSLYGKFGQKFKDKETIIANPSFEELRKFSHVEQMGHNYVRCKRDIEPSVFCFPEWAGYVTAHARLRIYDYITKYDALYCDTDSIVTEKEIPESKELGKMKKEMNIIEGIIVKPKFYSFVSDHRVLVKNVIPNYIDFNFKSQKLKFIIADEKEFTCLAKFKECVKIKGLPVKLSYTTFKNLMEDPKIEYIKFTRFKEGLRRGIKPNVLQEVFKEFSLEDNKRNWNDIPFSYKYCQWSEPVEIINGVITTEATNIT